MSSSSSMSGLALADVRVVLGGTQVLANITTHLRPGRLVALVGPNGAGKSTLLRAIAGLQAAHGTMTWNGQPLAALTPAQRARRVGYLPQGHQTHWPLPVRDIVGLGRFAHGASDPRRLSAGDAAIVDAAMVAAGVDHLAGRRATLLSGGEKARVALARVLALSPDILVFDEATAMLDPRGREQVMQTIHHLNKDLGITVVSITHYMEEAAQADRVLVMSGGHVVMEGTPKEVFSQTEKVRSLHLDVPQAAELRDELVKAGIPMPEGIIDTGACAQALYELLQ